LDDLADDLAAALAFGPEHISAYALTLEAGTPFERAARSGRLALPDDDLVAEMLDRVAETLGAGGLARYEVSSFARAGCESRHNRAATGSDDPCSASGRARGRASRGVRAQPFGARAARTSATSRPGSSDVEGGADARRRSARSSSDEATARGEAVFLALRTARGTRSCGPSLRSSVDRRAHIFAKAIDELVAAGLLREAPDGSLALSPRGFLLSDSVFERFV
jgi:oxygen-independent coproporphyrinogen-3 oxidase